MPKKKSYEDLSNEELALKGIDYANKKTAIKELEAQCKECRKPLEAAIVSAGRITESGSRLLVLSHADVEVHLKQTLRVGKVLLPEAIDVLKENGLEECIEEVPTIREDVIENLYNAGKISDEVLARIYKSKETYAFSVELKDKMGDSPE